MQPFETAISPASPDFLGAPRRVRGSRGDPPVPARREASRAAASGPSSRHRERGKIPVRDRVDLLLDIASPFLELSPLAAYGLYGGEVPAAGIVTGIGLVAATPCMIVANDATVKGGSFFAETVRKHLRAQEIAEQHRLPCLYLVDCGGAYLLEQDRVFPDRDHFGGAFFNQCRMSAAGIPQLSIVFGAATAGGAYIPGAVGRGRDGARHRPHPSRRPADRQGGRARGRRRRNAGRRRHAYDRVGRLRPRRGRRALGAGEAPRHRGRARRRAPASRRRPSHPSRRGSIRRRSPGSWAPTSSSPTACARSWPASVDASAVHEFKPDYGATLVCAFARIHGYPVAILANDGVLFSESALKGAHFIELADQRQIPLVFLQNITGFMVGTEAERGGIAKHSAKLVYAVSNARVPKYTILIGGSYGAGNYGMCGRGFRPRFLFSWPNARIATMSPEVASGVVTDLRRGSIRHGAADEAAIAEVDRRTRAQFEEQSDPYYATSRLWDDGIIEPGQTRDVLGLCLALAAGEPRDTSSRPVYRM